MSESDDLVGSVDNLDERLRVLERLVSNAEKRAEDRDTMSANLERRVDALDAELDKRAQIVDLMMWVIKHRRFETISRLGDQYQITLAPLTGTLGPSFRGTLREIMSGVCDELERF